MPLRVEENLPGRTLGTYIQFEDTCGSKSGITRVFGVYTLDGGAELLGRVEWAGRWRKYVFSPARTTALIFEEVCLREIAEFIETKTREHRAARKAATA